MQLRAESEKMGIEKKSMLFRLLIRFVCIVVIIYVLYSMIAAEVNKTSYQTEYNDLTLQCEAIEEENARLSRYIDGTDAEAEKYLEEYIEQSAREKLDLAYPDERVYYIVPKN